MTSDPSQVSSRVPSHGAKGQLPALGNTVPLVNLSGLPLPESLSGAAEVSGEGLTLVPSISSALELGSDSRILVVVDDPVDSVARHLRGGQPPSIAVRTWESYAREILSCLRSHRRSIVTITGAMLEEPTSELDTVLEDELGVSLRRPHASGDDGAVPAPPSGLLRLLSLFILQAEPETRALANELWAMLPARDAEDPMGAKAADLAFEAMQSQASELETLKAQHAHLTATLHLQQAELASAERRRSQNVDLGLHRESVLGSVLMERCDALDGLRHRTTALEQEREARTDEAARLRGEIELLHRSTSWRITAPLRALGRAIRRS